MTDTTRPIPVRRNLTDESRGRRMPAPTPPLAGQADADGALAFPETPAPEPPPAPKPQPTFTIHALLDDFPFEVSFTGSADTLKATVDRLRQLGAVPPTSAARQAVEEEKAREAPVCQWHGPMKESSKQPGSYYCPKRMGDGSYCKERWPEK